MIIRTIELRPTDSEEKLTVGDLIEYADILQESDVSWLATLELDDIGHRISVNRDREGKA